MQPGSRFTACNLSLLLIFPSVSSAPSAQTLLGTAFAHQGQLNVPGSGVYDLQSLLFDGVASSGYVPASPVIGVAKSGTGAATADVLGFL